MVVDAVPAWVIFEKFDPGAPDRLVMRIIGELDADTRPLIEPQIMAAVAPGVVIVLDLGELTFCDSTGISMFLMAREAATANGATITFRHVVGPVRRVFATAGVEAVFELSS